MWTTKIKALAAALMLMAAMAMGLLAPAPARASAFPGANGKIVFTSDRTTGTGVNNPDGDFEIFAMNPDGTALKQLTKNSVADSNPSYSPDGKKIVFDSTRSGPGNPDVVVMNSDGTGQKNITNNPAQDETASFSPDGRKILFVSDRKGNNDVFVMDAANGANKTDLTLNTAIDFQPDWQPKAATFTVTTASDTGDGACDSTCTLREAIGASNAVLGQIQNTIKFNVPGTGVHTITPSTDLPNITHSTVLDGYTQPGASRNTLATGTNAKPKIELSGTNAGGSGLRLGGTDPSRSVVRGLVINRFLSNGIFVEHTAGGSRIEGNFIGTDPTGTVDRGNSTGVVLFAKQNVVGGDTPAARNLISGNGEGVELSSGAQGNRLLGNLIGTTASGSAPLGNDFWGVAMFNSLTSNNRIGDGTAAGSNIIAFNERDGIEIDFPSSATGNQISRNSIFSNGGLGIDLIGGTETEGTNISTPNDAGDADTGANNLQNKPVITSAKTSSTKTTITGKLNSTPGKTFKIELFSNPSDQNEGKRFVGQKSVTTDGSGNASFSFSPAAKVPVGQTITATATDSSKHDTSEFSAPGTVATS